MANSEPPQTGLSRTLVTYGVSGTPWYAIIDAAQGKTSPQRAAEVGLQTQSLYDGELGRQLDDVAPHLVSFSLKDEFARWLFGNWGGNHGVLLQSQAHFKDVRRHLRKFTLVKDEQQTKYRFRFYDPRVLRSFLPACSFDEAKQFFGPVARYYAAGRSGASVVAFGWGPRGLTVRELPVQTAATSAEDPDMTPVFTEETAPPAGELVIALVDAESNEPIVGASVQVSGPVTERLLSNASGKALFRGIAIGEYEIFAMDAQHRWGKGNAVVKEGRTRTCVSCRRVGKPSEIP